MRNTRSTFLAAVVLAVAAAAPAAAQGGAQEVSVGAGVKINTLNLTAAGIKAWVTQNVAVDTSIGFSVGQGADAVIWDANLTYALAQQFESGKTPPIYFGAGVWLNHPARNVNTVGMRLPFGITHRFDKAPVEVVVEAAPVMQFNNAFSFTMMTGALGFYYHF